VYPNLRKHNWQHDHYEDWPLNVICLNSINLTKAAITLNGNSTDLFVINVTSPTAGFILASSQIVLSGELTADRVIFNFPGTGGMLNIFKNDTVFMGTLLAPQRDIVIDNPAVFGSVHRFHYRHP
jgi:choice-of-anchor A domain-containing protein